MTVKTYSSHPFIGLDGMDENGVRAEVKVVKGYGIVSKIEPSSAGKSENVFFSVENTKYLPSGWAPVDSEVIKKIEAAQASGEPIHFRIETRRQDKIDRTIPINDLANLSKAKDSIHKSLAAVKLDDDDEWTISPFAKTNFLEDPKTGVGSPSAAHLTAEELKALKGDTGSVAASVSHSGIEPPPYVTFNRDGDLNPGSLAVAVPLNLHSFLVEYASDRNLELSRKMKSVVLNEMLSVTNKAQLEIYGDQLKKPDLSLGSHTRARALLFDCMKTSTPLTDDILSNEASVSAWGEEILANILTMWKWSITLVMKLENNE